MKISFINADNGKSASIKIESILQKEFDSAKRSYTLVYGSKAITASLAHNLKIGRVLTGLTEEITDNITKGWVMQHHFPNLRNVDRSNLIKLFALASDANSGFEAWRMQNFPNVRTVNYLLQLFRDHVKFTEVIDSTEFADWSKGQEKGKVPSITKIKSEGSKKVIEIGKAFKKAEKAITDKTAKDTPASDNPATASVKESHENFALSLNELIQFNSKKPLTVEVISDLQKRFDNFINQVSRVIEKKVASK